MYTQLRELQKAAENLFRLNVPCKVPCKVLAEDKYDFLFHLSSVKDEMESHLGRHLTAAEITCLSISHRYGPVPIRPAGMSEDAIRYLIERPVYPHWANWDAVLEALNELEKQLEELEEVEEIEKRLTDY